MTLMLGLSLALGCVAVSFAQDTTTTKKTSKKKSSKKKEDRYHQELVVPPITAGLLQTQSGNPLPSPHQMKSL